MALASQSSSCQARGGLARRAGSALLAGGIAIALNTFVLSLADVAHLPTAHGGLLKLLMLWFGPVADQLAGFVGRPDVRLWLTRAASFQLGFHILVGLIMAVVYALFVSPLLKMGPLAKGLICALAVWLANAAVVLPSIGEGFAGRVHLTIAGIVAFAAAHTLFFLVLSFGFETLTRTAPARA